MTQQEYYIDIVTFKPEPCEWGAWNQYLIFQLMKEDIGNGDLVRVIGPVKTVAGFLTSEGMDYLVRRILPLVLA